MRAHRRAGAQRGFSRPPWESAVTTKPRSTRSATSSRGVSPERGVRPAAAPGRLMEGREAEHPRGDQPPTRYTMKIRPKLFLFRTPQWARLAFGRQLHGHIQWLRGQSCRPRSANPVPIALQRAVEPVPLGRVGLQVGHRGSCRGEMPEISSLHPQDRKDTWRFRRYSNGFAMYFDR